MGGQASSPIAPNEYNYVLQKNDKINVPHNVLAPSAVGKEKTTKRGTLSRPHFAFRKNVVSILIVAG